MLEVKDTANKRGAKAEFFALIAITGRKDTKAFDITVNMLNINSAFRDERISLLFIRRKFSIFGGFYWSGTVGMNLGNALITFVSKDFSFWRKMDTTILQQGKIMLLSC